MVEALKFSRDGGLLLGEFQVVMHAMQQERIFVGRHGPRLKAKEVGCCSKACGKINHTEVPTISDGHSHPASGRFQQIALRDRIDGEETAVMFLVDVATGRYWPLLVDRGKAEWA